ncbi:MAG: ATP-dependent dethiobiotin synthetase BioD 1 [Planctomycetes bacterium ADurb.Bin401]|nr:MAG: ATP-dependent dethiobiotin synthetase BioD 1 [Planctomycetes bacterium ADurb.Bin401]
MEIFKHKGLFITATDTGVGKTLIAGAIAKILSEKGKRVGVFKPVATGCKKTNDGLVGEDAEYLAKSIDGRFSLSQINPETFEEPAAPLACEIKENRKVDLVKIFNAYNYMCSVCDYIIVEGIGGIRVPITDGLDVLGLAKMFGLPVVIAARPGLGTINHTLLTIEAVRNAQLPLAGVIISGYDELNSDFAHRSAPEIIARAGQTEILAAVPFDKQTDIGQGIIGRNVLDSLTKIDFVKVMEKNER